MASRLFPTTRRLFRQVIRSLRAFGLGAALCPLTFSLLAIYITGLLLLDRRQNGTRIADWLPARAHDAINRLLRTHTISTRAQRATSSQQALQRLRMGRGGNDLVGRAVSLGPTGRRMCGELAAP